MHVVYWIIATTYDGALEKVYVNGVLKCSLSAVYTLPSLVRMYNYIGKPFSSTFGYSWSYLDDLKFFNKSLNQSEISSLMNENQTSTFNFIFDF